MILRCHFYVSRHLRQTAYCRVPQRQNQMAKGALAGRKIGNPVEDVVLAREWVRASCAVEFSPIRSLTTCAKPMQVITNSMMKYSMQSCTILLQIIIPCFDSLQGAEAMQVAKGTTPAAISASDGLEIAATVASVVVLGTSSATSAATSTYAPKSRAFLSQA